MKPARTQRDGAQVLERLMLEAGTVALNWKSETHRAHAAREAARVYLPSETELGPCRALAGRALRDCIRALGAAHTDQAREQLATATRAMVAAIRAEPVRVAPALNPERSVRNYWADR